VFKVRVIEGVFGLGVDVASLIPICFTSSTWYLLPHYASPTRAAQDSCTYLYYIQEHHSGRAELEVVVS
jgi:hypothetical protein